MKLRNKKTGEILELCCHRSGDFREKYESLAELNAEWEDYEEPKTHWTITEFGDVADDVDGYMPETIDEMKKIGNYFESKEEAEKAVEKLKAWKRLKEYGVKFNLDFVENNISFTYSINNLLLDVLDGEEQIFNDMKIIFGGEE